MISGIRRRLARLESVVLPKPYRPRFNRFVVELPSDNPGELVTEIYEGDFTNLVEVKHYDRSIPNV